MHFWDVKFLAQKSGRVNFLTNLMSGLGVWEEKMTGVTFILIRHDISISHF